MAKMETANSTTFVLDKNVAKINTFIRSLKRHYYLC